MPPTWKRASANAMEKAFYGDDVDVVTPVSYEELAEVVRFAEAHKRPLVPSGLGSHAYLGNPPPPGALVVSLRELRGILRYEPDDFTIGVQAGLPLSDLRKALLENNQEIAVDFSDAAPGTVGGLVAAAQPGPRYGRYGPIRSTIIGVHALRGGPSPYKAGGMVVKNVAGYEIAKFLAGSLGTAGVLQEVNFKLRPLPETRSMRAVACSSTTAWEIARRVQQEQLEPASLWVAAGPLLDEIRGVLSNFDAGGAERLLVWLFEGTKATVKWQENEVDRVLGALEGEKAERSVSRAFSKKEVIAVHRLACEFGEVAPEPTTNLGVARLGVLPHAAAGLEASVGEAVSGAATLTDALTGLCTARWSGPQEDLCACLPGLQAIVERTEGTGVLLYLPAALRRQWSYLLASDVNRDLTHRILRVFDPAGVFSPGRVLACQKEPRE